MDERNFTYMFYGFLAAWMILMIYVLSLAAREKKIRRQMEDLRQMVEEREKR
jgi:CcmD family protein